MEFEAWKKMMESDATKENEELKAEIEQLRKENTLLMKDCMTLGDRCYLNIANHITKKHMCDTCTLPCQHKNDFNNKQNNINLFIKFFKNFKGGIKK